MRIRRLVGMLGVGGALLAAQVPAAGSTPSTLTIGVDHFDPANQQPALGRLFEYTDFFSRSVRIHPGDTLDFSFHGFHDIAVTRSEALAQGQEPLATPDADNEPSVATGKSKLLLNPAVFVGSENGRLGPCGWTAPCVYKGGDDLDISGFPQGPPGTAAHWKVTVDTTPGRFTYFCYIHPGMRGTFSVVSEDQPTTTQAQNDAASQQQFLKDQEQALAAERRADVVRVRGGEPGDRTYVVLMGISAAEDHVAIDEVFPNSVRDPSKQLNLVAGDRVLYLWPDGHNAHSVTFPPDAVEPFGEDCPAGLAPPPPGTPPPPPGTPPPALCATPEESHETVVDPGNAPSGTELTTPATTVDAGVRLGKDFHLPTTTRWTVTTGDATTSGTYHFNCNIHDFMRGSLNVAPSAGDDSDTAHRA